MMDAQRNAIICTFAHLLKEKRRKMRDDEEEKDGDDDDRSVVDGGDEDIAEIIDLIDLRAEARFNRNYDEADRLRERLKRVGR